MCVCVWGGGGCKGNKRDGCCTCLQMGQEYLAWSVRECQGENGDKSVGE